MKKVILLLGTLLFITSVYAQDVTFLKGDFNSWDSSMPMILDDTYYSHIFQYTGVTGEQNFKIHEQNADYWYGLTTVPDFINSSFITIYSGDGTNIKQTLINNKFYTFKTSDPTDVPANPNRSLVVFETDATPANIVSVTDDSLTATTSLTVTIVTDANVTQDSVYVRYAINSEWGSAIVLKATKTADMTYQAVISGLSPSDVVTYYVMTSSFPQATLESAPDVYFLNRETNGGENFTYTAPVATILKHTNAIDFNVTSYNNHLSVDVNSDMMQKASMTLINLAGQVSAEYNTQLMTGNNTIDLPYQLTRGIYVLQVKVGTDKYVQKIAIQ